VAEIREKELYAVALHMGHCSAGEVIKLSSVRL
jgi:hypothetical protein